MQQHISSRQSLDSTTLHLNSLQPIPRQAAGHANTIFKSAERPGVVLKPVDAREQQFYEEASQDALLVPFLPRYDGALLIDQRTVLLLEDVTFGYEQACVMDVKIGYCTAGENASDAKRAAMRKKDLGTTTCTLGLRICGMQVYDSSGASLISHGKPWGKALTDSTFGAGLAEFFVTANNDGGGALARLDGVLAQLRPLHAYMAAQRQRRFYSSSLLFAYDATSAAAPPRVRMIDMAHVFAYRDDDDVGDNGYAEALSRLIALLEALKASLQL